MKVLPWRPMFAAWALLGGPSACAEGVETPRERATPPQTAAAPAEAPSTREGFLAELAPVPRGPVSVEYDVQGPSGIEGTLTVWLAEGARRREEWTLAMPIPGGPDAAIVGSALATPDREWTGGVEGSATVRERPLGRLADAYLELDASGRGAVVGQVRRWHREVERGRAEHPGTVDTVAGQSCLRTLTAGQSLCVWEETGLPLEYRSDAFTLTARTVGLGVELPEDGFSMPAAGRGPPLAPEHDFDPGESLAAVAAGNLAELAMLLAASATHSLPSWSGAI